MNFVLLIIIIFVCSVVANSNSESGEEQEKVESSSSSYDRQGRLLSLLETNSDNYIYRRNRLRQHQQHHNHHSFMSVEDAERIENISQTVVRDDDDDDEDSLSFTYETAASGVEDIRNEWRGAETPTLKKLKKLEDLYANSMKLYREGGSGMSLRELDKIGERYKETSRKHRDELEAAKRMVMYDNILVRENEPAIARQFEAKDHDEELPTTTYDDEEEDFWKKEFNGNEFPSEPLASNLYFPLFEPTRDGEMICKKILVAEEATNLAIASRASQNNIVTVGNEKFRTIGKLVEFGVVQAEQNLFNMYREFKRENNDDEKFAFKFIVDEKDAEAHVFSRVSKCTKRRTYWECLFGEHEDALKKGRQYCESLLAISTMRMKKDSITSMDWDDFFSFKARRDFRKHLLFTGVILNFMTPKIFIAQKFSSVKCSKSNSIDLDLQEKNDVLIISVHGRRGDSCNYWMSRPQIYGISQWENKQEGRPCIDTIQYHKALELLVSKYENNFSSVSVLLGSDSEEFIKEMTTVSTNSNYNYCWIDAVGHRSVYGIEKRAKKNTWIEDRRDLNDEISDMSLAELDFLSRGYAIVGGMYSHFTRSVYYRISGRLGTAAPYISLDGGGFIRKESIERLLKDESLDIANEEMRFQKKRLSHRRMSYY
jgi:hypothetical protein